MCLNIREGRRKITAVNYPAFLYDANIDYDPENIAEGLLKGPLLLMVSLSIFVSFISCFH